jgi:hypothetical protein
MKSQLKIIDDFASGVTMISPLYHYFQNINLEDQTD